MLTNDRIPFIDNTTAHSQSADPHMEQQGISITMPNRQQLHIHNIYIPPRSSCNAGHNASVTHLLSNNEISLIDGDIYAHHSRWDTNTNEYERGEQYNNFYVMFASTRRKQFSITIKGVSLYNSLHNFVKLQPTIV